MSKKLQKFLDDADKLEAKIAEMQDNLRSIRKAQKEEEDCEIIRSIRGRKLGGRELLALLERIQDGSVTFLVNEKMTDNEPAARENVPEMEDMIETA